MRSQDWLWPLATTLALCGCGGGGEKQQITLPAVDAATKSQAETAAELSPDPGFTTSQTIDGSQYGLIGDGTTINTQIFRSLVAGGHRTIVIHKGDYLTGSIVLDGNTVLELEPGTTLRDTGQLGPEESFITIATENVRINGAGARVIASRSDYTTGEYRHGVAIYGARNVVIDGLESSSHGGDGFYVGGPTGKPSTDIVLRNCRADNNRRQGLSITSARRVRVTDCEFVNTNGTAPEFGIDMEPNYPTDTLDDIIFLRPSTDHNRGGGIMIELIKLNATSERVGITIVDHHSSNEDPALHLLNLGDQADFIRYSRAP